MAQEKEIDIPPTETTLICFQPPNPAPTSPTHNPIPATSRSEEILIASLPETPSTDQRFYEPELIAAANRCSGCRRKVGLTGFRCRCGELFCGKHRYSDRHDCSFDYKTAGMISISRDNPVVRAAKIVRI